MLDLLKLDRWESDRKNYLFFPSPPAFVIKFLLGLREMLMRMQRLLMPAPLVMSELLVSYWYSQALITAAKLGIADHLSIRPRSCDDLAEILNCDNSALYRLMRTLAGQGIFKEVQPKMFTMTPLAEPLKRDHPQSVRDLCLLQGAAFHWQSWQELEYSVRTGKPSLQKNFGGSLFEYLQSHPDENALFNRAMGNWTNQANQVIARSFPFSNFKSIIDIGGGNGAFLKALLEMHPHCKATVFDQAHVVGLNSGSLNFVAGSFFGEVPAGYDLYILKNILHDWNDEKASQILGNLRSAMGENSRLLIIETLVPRGNSFHMSKMLDLEMLVVTHGGVERTLEQFQDLASAHQFQLVRNHSYGCLESVLELKPCL